MLETTEIFFSPVPPIAKIRRNVFKRSNDEKKELNVDLDSVENSIRVSLDIVKEKTTSGLSWLRTKLTKMKDDYNTFKKESNFDSGFFL